MAQSILRSGGWMLVAWLAVAFPSTNAEDLQTGDIIFQDSQSSQSQAIKAATHSPYSHVGVVVIQEGKPYVAEAIQPVSLTPLDAWIARGRDRHYVVKRLNAPAINPQSEAKLQAEAKKYLKRDYDWKFAWSDDEIYCSELVWKIYQRSLGVELCELKSLKDFDLSPPIVRKTLARRYGEAIPLSEPVVAPADIFQSPRLVTVATKKTP